VSVRIDLDLRQGLAAPRVAPEGDGHLALTFARPQETVVLHLSRESVDALWLALTAARAWEARS
jgi:hypothetical protein